MNTAITRSTSYAIFRWASVLMLIALVAALVVGQVIAPNVQAQTSYNYGEALQKSIWFYEAQVSGPTACLGAGIRPCWMVPIIALI